MTPPCCTALRFVDEGRCGPQCLRTAEQLPVFTATQCVCTHGWAAHDRVVGMIPQGILAEGAKPWASLTGCHLCGCTIFEPDNGVPMVWPHAAEPLPPLPIVPGEPWYSWYEQATARVELKAGRRSG